MVEGAGVAPFTLAHDVRSPEEVPSLPQLAAGVEAPVWGPLARAWGGFTCYFADPDGFRWEVAWNPGPVGVRVAPDTDVDARP